MSECESFRSFENDVVIAGEIVCVVGFEMNDVCANSVDANDLIDDFAMRSVAFFVRGNALWEENMTEIFAFTR